MENFEFLLLDNGSCMIKGLTISSNVWTLSMMDISIHSLGANDNGKMIDHNWWAYLILELD